MKDSMSKSVAKKVITTLEMTRRYIQALGFEDVFKRHVLASPVDRLVR
jgi:hypothetical protein